MRISAIDGNPARRSQFLHQEAFITTLMLHHISTELLHLDMIYVSSPWEERTSARCTLHVLVFPQPVLSKCSNWISHPVYYLTVQASNVFGDRASQVFSGQNTNPARACWLIVMVVSSAETPNDNFRKISVRKTIRDLEFSEHLL